MKRKIRIGIIMIVLGIISIVSQLDVINENFILPIVSIGLFAMYFVSGGKKHGNNIGFLIPACIVPMVQIEAYLDDYTNLIKDLEGTTFFILLGTAFLLVYFIHSFWRKQDSFGTRHWPIITAGIIYLFSLLLFVTEYLEWGIGEIILANIWPVVLIAAGVIMVIKNYNKKQA